MNFICLFILLGLSLFKLTCLISYGLVFMMSGWHPCFSMAFEQFSMKLVGLFRGSHTSFCGALLSLHALDILCFIVTNMLKFVCKYCNRKQCYFAISSQALKVTPFSLVSFSQSVLLKCLLELSYSTLQYPKFLEL
ncbi:hypothetical protein ACOSQ4_011885 [Xanthoceras sorbifolium]